MTYLNLDIQCLSDNISKFGYSMRESEFESCLCDILCRVSVSARGSVGNKGGEY